MIRGGLVTLFVRDLTRAVRFYVETLGMKLTGEAPASATIDAGDGLRIQLHQRGASMGAPGMSAPAIVLHPKVPLREAIAILENRGVAFEIDASTPDTAARFGDPDGNTLYLCEPH